MHWTNRLYWKYVLTRYAYLPSNRAATFGREDHHHMKAVSYKATSHVTKNATQP